MDLDRVVARRKGWKRYLDQKFEYLFLYNREKETPYKTLTRAELILAAASFGECCCRMSAIW